MRRENSYHRKALIPSIFIRAGLAIIVLCLLCADAAPAEAVVFRDRGACLRPVWYNQGQRLEA